MRHRSPLFMLLLALALLSACGFGGGPPETAADATTLPGAATPSAATPGRAEFVTIGFGASESERSTYEPLIEAFNRQNPGIRVQFVALEEFMQTAAGEAFDLAQMLRRIVSAADTASVSLVGAEDLRSGLVRDLRPLIDADANFKADDYYPRALDAAGTGGSVYLLPRTLRVQLLSYNKDLWAARGLPAPKPNWSWSDLIGAAEQLAHKRGDTVEVYGLLDWGSGFTVLMHELDASGVKLAGTPADHARLDRPEVAAALERVGALAKSGALYIRAREPGEPSDEDEMRKLIVAGRAGIWPRETLSIGGDAARPTFAVGTAGYPLSPLPSPGESEGYVMSSGTQHPQEAWRWLSFLSRQEIGPSFAGPDDIGQLPARASIAERSGYWSRLDAEAAAAVKAAITRLATPAAGDFDQRLFQPLTKALHAVVSGKQKAEQALRDAQAELDRQIAQAPATPAPTAEREPVVVSTPLVEAAPAGATSIAFGAFVWEADQIRSLVRQFNQSNSAVYIQLKTIEPTDASFGLADAAATSDCFMWDQPSQDDQISATLDLQPLIDADATLKQEDYPPALLAPFRHAGGLYGLPYAVKLRVLSYNKEAFDAAGLSYPTANWTMDDFLNAAQKLTTGEGANKRYGYAAIDSPALDLFFFLNRFGASATRGSGDALVPNFVDPKVVQTVRYYVDLLRNYSLNRELQGYGNSNSFGVEFFELLNAGRIGMWFGEGNSYFPNPPSTFTRAIAPPPLGKGPLAPEDVSSNGLFISARTQQAQACWEWLKRLSAAVPAPDPDIRFPARLSVAESDTFLNGATAGAAAVYAAYRAALDRTSAQDAREPVYRSKVDFFWFLRAADRALHGKNLERELADAQSLTEQFLACVHSGGKPRACAKQVDPTYEGWNREQ